MKIGKVKHRYRLAPWPDTKNSRIRTASMIYNMESNLLTRAQTSLLTMLRTHRMSCRFWTVAPAISDGCRSSGGGVRVDLVKLVGANLALST